MRVFVKGKIENLIKSFCRGSRGAVFSKSAPLAVLTTISQEGNLRTQYCGLSHWH